MSTNYTGLSSIADVFAQQATLTPDVIAVESGAEALTYAALNKRANQLGHYLLSIGVGPDIRVGICLERSLDLIVSILGVLKAGGTYVPLDPAYPVERLSFMLRDSGAVALISHSHQESNIPLGSVHRINIDATPAIWQHSSANPPCIAAENQLAYVMYTSGSTGMPKGVMVEHRGWLNYIRSARHTYRLQPGERMLQFASISWDTSAEEIFPCLGSGATLVLRSADMLDSIPRFLEACADKGITCLNLPTAYWHELVTEVEEHGLRLPASLRMVIIGGEQAHGEFYLKWRQVASKSVHLYNTYGQTECTAVTTCVELAGELPDGVIPLGAPIENVQVYLLDERLQPVPDGKPGELYIGGPGVARGYLNQPELTHQKFIANPFSVLIDSSAQYTGGAQSTGSARNNGNGSAGAPIDRLYKTGDLARCRQDGNLEFIGRADQQLKIRGIRIEPGEIEGTLAQHPAVRLAAVVGQPIGPRPKYLVAYVVLKRNTHISASELRSWLSKRLPHFLIPSVILFIDALPLTPNGKLDRAALPVPDFSELTAPSGDTEPENEMQARLQQIWKEILGLKSIGLHDDFFEIGGHSLLVVRMMTRLERELGKPLSLALIFHAPTIAQMANALRDQGWKPTWSSLVPIRPQGSHPPLFCVHADGGAFFYARFAGHLSPEQPFYGLQARGLDGTEPPFTCLEDMAAHYLTEMRTIQSRGPYLISGFSLGGLVIYEMAQQLLALGESPPLVVFLDAPSPAYYEEQDTRLTGKLLHLTRLSFQVGLRRVQHRMGQRYRWLRDEALSRLYLRFNRPLTPALRIHRVRETNHAIADLYTPKPYPGPVTILRASQQIRRTIPDPTLGWGQYVSGPIMEFEIPGDHETIFHEPNVRVMAETLQACIEDWLSRKELSQVELVSRW